MQRWHLTAGLTVLALGAALVAPRLTALVQQPAPPPEPPVVEPPAPSAASGPLLLDAGLDRTAVLDGRVEERFLTLRVTAPEVQGEAARRPVDLAVVMDTSGSMSARGKIDYARRAARLLASSMEEGDVYALVTFADDATTIVPATGVADVGAIHRAIDGIYEGGGTNLFAGLTRGAREVREALREGAVGRVVVLSDGRANVGVTDGASLSRFAADLAADGLSVSTIGLGVDYNEDLLASMADLGGGTYDFVDDPTSLETVFADELERTASVVGRGVRLDLALPDNVELVEVIGWSTTPSDGGTSIWMGDVYAGETRKVVVRVRVDGAGDGEMPVADASLHYVDAIDGAAASAHATARATVTDDEAVVRAAVDAERAVDANRAWGNQFLEMSTRAYADGDVAASQRLLEQGQAVLREASAAYAAPALADEADDLEATEQIYEMHAAGSHEGQRVIKASKELFRARVR